MKPAQRARKARLERRTRETDIAISLAIDGRSRYRVSTGIRFFDHILRAGYFLMPMDETLALAAVDFSGRTAAVIDTKVKTRWVGDLQSELVFDFFEGFARGAQANVHVKTLYGRSNHHKIEAIFKAFARAIRAACWRDPQMARLLPTTKGLL